MAWEHCGAEVLDTEPCPACGFTKAEWTVQVDRTRTFNVPGTARRPRSREAWIEVQLVARGEGPLPGEEYRIALPNGRVASGQLDGEGLVRVDGLSPGPCEVSFPGVLEPAVEVRTGQRHVFELEAWHQRQATSCGAYALAHALRLRTARLDANADGTVQQREWERVHEDVRALWPRIKFQSGPLAPHGYSSPAAMAVEAGAALEAFYAVEGPAQLRAWATGRMVMNATLQMTDLLDLVLGEAAARGVTVEAGDGLERVLNAPPGEAKLAVAPCDAGSYLHYVLFRRAAGGGLEVYDSQSRAYRWLGVDRPDRGASFSTPGSAGTLTYLGLALVLGPA